MTSQFSKRRSISESPSGWFPTAYFPPPYVSSLLFRFGFFQRWSLEFHQFFYVSDVTSKVVRDFNRHWI
ncbi:hypothetical protein HanIR_Chr03g0129541 [Helianthus annuus]|nr:hypothetical protein HanIR_Chr03g0129541 [Helianthus annuus]